MEIRKRYNSAHFELSKKSRILKVRLEARAAWARAYFIKGGKKWRNVTRENCNFKLCKRLEMLKICLHYCYFPKAGHFLYKRCFLWTKYFRIMETEFLLKQWSRQSQVIYTPQHFCQSFFVLLWKLFVSSQRSFFNAFLHMIGLEQNIVRNDFQSYV